MKKLLIPLVAILLASCGVSSSDKSQMETGLSVCLGDAFLAQDDFVSFSPKVELLEVEKGESSLSLPDGYHGTFSCSFEAQGSQVHLSGSVGFDGDGRVRTLPNGKLAIQIPSILVDSRMVAPDTSIYNLPVFSCGRQ